MTAPSRASVSSQLVGEYPSMTAPPPARSSSRATSGHHSYRYMERYKMRVHTSLRVLGSKRTASPACPEQHRTRDHNLSSSHGRG